MTDKTRWLGLGPWHEDNESELIDWTAQPQYKGLVKGDYYHAELRYSGRWGDPGHKGELDVVFDDDGKIAFAEFNETTMGNYYVRHFQNVSKRRTEFQFFQDFHDLFHIHKHFTHRKFLPSFYYTILYGLNYTILFCMGQVLSIHLPILFCMDFLVSTIWICYTQPIKKKTGDINIWQ